MKRVCVFLGSNIGEKASYLTETKKLGATLAKNKITLVYGGSNKGLMGELANAVLAHGGEVIGVIPQCLVNKNYAHENLTEIIPTESMTDRKALLKHLADGFIVLPGGIGTLDELFEVLTENKLGIHDKPVGILNIDNFYDSMFTFLDKMVEAKFFTQEQTSNIVVASESQQLLGKLIQAKELNKLKPKPTPTTSAENISVHSAMIKQILRSSISFKKKLLLNSCTLASLAMPLF